jgi:hypothetical protein
VPPAPLNQDVANVPKEGRPLFKRELSKVVPPPNNYDIKRNIEIEPLREKGVCQFGHSWQSYRKTCDITKDIKIYEKDSRTVNPDDLNPSYEAVKKQNPIYS